jgi:uncharacterized Zn-finger protein
VSDTLVINEIYLSLQGESTFAGLPCVFIRLTACDLRCSYCDTAYAFTEGKKMPLAEILAEVGELAAPFSNSKSRLSKIQTAAGRIDRRRTAAPKKFPAADEIACATTASPFCSKPAARMTFRRLTRASAASWI